MILLTSCGNVTGGGSEEPTVWHDVSQRGAGSDSFGVAKLYPDAPGGMEWVSAWERGGAILDDPWIQLGSNNVRYVTEEGEGELVITGETHRLYVRDPDLERQWRDVEITTYFKRVADDGVAYSGLTSVARTNHGVTGELNDAPCDSRGLSARVRNDGLVDFGKEVSHPKTVATEQRRLFPGDLPMDEWVGYKHVVRDVVGGVLQELWMDPSGDGGWIMVAEHLDPFEDGDWGAEQESCADGVDPALGLNGSGVREGSESGLPNIAVMFRADGLWADGLRYKWTSVREIAS